MSNISRFVFLCTSLQVLFDTCQKVSTYWRGKGHLSVLLHEYKGSLLYTVGYTSQGLVPSRGSRITGPKMTPQILYLFVIGTLTGVDESRSREGVGVGVVFFSIGFSVIIVFF